MTRTRRPAGALLPAAARIPWAALLLVAALAGCAGTGRTEAAGYRGLMLAAPVALPATQLQATDGGSGDLVARDPGTLRLVFFGYTHCGDVCPTTMADIASALRRVPAGDRRRTRVWFVTTDPARDTLAATRGWLSRFNPSFVGFTGSATAVAAAAKGVGVPLLPAEKRPDGGYDVGHGSQVLAFTPDGRAHLLWLAGTTIGDYGSDIRRLLHDRAYDHA